MSENLYNAVREKLSHVGRILNPCNSGRGLIIEHCNIFSSQEKMPLGEIYFTFNIRFSLHGVLHRIQCSEYVTLESVQSIPDIIQSKLAQFIGDHRAA